MNALDRIHGIVQEAVDQAVSHLISVHHWPDCSFVNLPMVYPDGSDVTVKVLRAVEGFRVTDNEFAFREAEVQGLSRTAFNRLADDVLQGALVGRIKQSVFVDADEATLGTAISEVASASWKIAHSALSAAEDEDIVEPEAEILTDRLVSIFGKPAVSVRPKLIGASTSPWRFTAVVSSGGSSSAFQQVTEKAYSIFRACSAFSDIADLPNPPKLIAVVDSKASLGSKLGLISRSGYVIEAGQTDDAFVRVAA